jgi:hypothetical protein
MSPGVAGRVQRRLGEIARRLEREVARLEVLAGSLRPEDEADADAMAEGQEPPGLEFYASPQLAVGSGGSSWIPPQLR